MADAELPAQHMNYTKMKSPRCKLARIINPGNYCVVSIDKQHVEAVESFEEKMKRKEFFDVSSNFTLNCQMCVAVSDSNGKFKRGIILERISSDSYKVLLMDYGTIVQKNKSEIYVITDEEILKIEPLAFNVKLYGLIPASFTIEDKKLREISDWSSEAHVFVQKLLKSSFGEIIVESVQIENRTVFGDIFIKPRLGATFVSLGEMLSKNNYCIYSEAKFLEHEKLNSESLDKDFSSKMEFVRKWQQESFSNFPNLKPDLNPILPGCSPSHNSDTQTPNVTPPNSEKRSEEVEQNGVGRGKIKQLLQEMKKISSETSKGNLESHPSFGNNGCTTVTRGRGYLLHKYLQTKSFEVESKSSIESGCENVTKPKPYFKKPFVLPEGFKDLDSSEKEDKMSPSTEELPPAIKKSMATIFGARSNSSNLTGSVEGDCEQTKPNSLHSELNSDEEKLTKECSNLMQASNLIKKSHLWTPYVLFEDCVIEPVKTFRELPIQTSIIMALGRKGGFHELSQIQRWAIPAIRKHHNTILIGSSKTGKTLSYVVHLVDYIQDESYFEELPPGNGPYVVIVASSSHVCESIYYFCQSLLSQSTKRDLIKVVMAHGSNCGNDTWVKLTNGCHILISTPHCLIRLLEMPILTNFERLTCLVLDEIDILSSKPFRKSVQIILQKARLGSQGSHHQIILCGEKWTPNVSSLVKKFVNPFALIIGSYSEAVIYEGVTPQIFLVEKTQKPEFLLNKIKDQIGKSKIVIVCEGTAEACELHDFFNREKFTAVLAHEDMMAEILKNTKTNWLSSPSSVLILTDGVIAETNIREAQTIVHYSLPATSKTNFYLRYSTLENFLRVKHDQKKTQWCDIILIDDENHSQLPPIIDFVLRLGGKVSPKILQKCEEIRRAKEIEKNAPLCEYLLSFGRCRNSKNCPRRHALVKHLDSPKVNHPRKSWVKFTVASVDHASAFSVWLTEEDATRAKDIKKKLSEFYKTENNQKPLGNSRIGELCAVIYDDVFHRAKIIEHLKVDKHGKPLEVAVKLIDLGTVQKRKCTHLYELPKDQHEPGTTVDVKIVGVQPRDFDESWSENANDFLRNIMSQNLQPGYYWSGRVALVLNDILFLDSVKRNEHLLNVNMHVFDLVVQDELLSNLAEPNEEHLKVLEKLCEEAGIDIAVVEDKSQEDLTVVEPQWAFFDSDFVRVKFCAADNTSIVFLQPQNFEKLLLDLEELCVAEAEKTLANKKEIKGLGVGKFCLAKFEDWKWNRGRIESETDTDFEVYFVDHGDVVFIKKENVTPISKSLLLRLPCQAIECSLVGVKPENDCPLEVLKKIYAFSDEGRDDLFASVISKDLKPTVTKGRKYSVCLYDQSGKCLNKMLVDCGMVQLEESEKEHLKDIELEVTREETEEDEAEEKVDVNETELTAMKDYFLNVKDEMFENEEGLNFLKEFASKVFPSLAPSSTSQPTETVKALPSSEQPAIKALPSSSEESTVKPSKPPKISTNVQKIMELHKKRSRKNKSSLLLKIRDGVFTPQVLWCQNQLEIQMKIQLENVADYSVECDVSNVSFRCFHNGKFYAVDLKLFGAINPQMTKVTAKAWHVVVILTKLASPSWPRLHADEEKHRWINLDVESLVDKEEGFFASTIKAAKVAIEKGETVQKVTDEKIKPFSDSEFSYESESDDSSIAQELEAD